MRDRDKFMVRLVVAVALMCVAAGCVHSPGGVAPSNVPIEGRAYEVLGETRGSDSKVALLGLLPISGANLTRHALDDAIESKSADALINITVDVHTEYWILWSSVTTSVTGQAIKFTPTKAEGP